MALQHARLIATPPAHEHPTPYSGGAALWLSTACVFARRFMAAYPVFSLHSFCSSINSGEQVRR
jgi:hypothetical protein